MIVIPDDEMHKILKDFGMIRSRQDAKRFLDSGILKERGEPLFEDRYPLYRKFETDKILWVDFWGERMDAMYFTFDKIHFYSFYKDYPQKLTEEERRLFIEENEIFKDW